MKAPDDPSGAYRSATERVALRNRSERTRLVVRGRAPEQVLSGLVSGRIPQPLVQLDGHVWRGRAEGSALLDPKGKMVAELRLLRGGPTPDDGFLIDFPPECRDRALAHLRKYVPPRLATAREVSSETGMLSALGAGASQMLAQLPQIALAPSLLDSLADGDLLHLSGDGASLTLIRTGEVATPAFDVWGPHDAVRELWAGLVETGAEPVDQATWDILRVEAGRPAYGFDMDDTTIPVEAGIHPRVVDYQKGCFTGQEVLIRIRDRGHVNRRLRGLRMGEIDPPASGTQLFRPNEERAIGHVTSTARSPRFGEVIGLGYVRREVEPPAELCLGSPQGSPVRVRDLESGWTPDERSP